MPSRKRLFRAIKLAAVERGHCPECSRLFSILSNHQEIVPHIRELSVSGGDWILQDETLPLLLHRIAEAECLQRFAILTISVTSWMKFGSILQGAFRSLLSSPRLIKLSLLWNITRDFPVEYLVLPPALEDLVIDEFGSDLIPPNNVLPSNDQNTSSASGSHQLRSLKIQGDYTSGLLTYLTRPLCTIQLSHLRDLSIGYTSPELMGQFQKVLEVAAPSLERLIWESQRYYYNQDNDDPDLLTPLDLSQLGRLRTLELQLYPEPCQFRLTTTILRGWRIPNRLRRLTLKFNCYYFSVGFGSLTPREDGTAFLSDANVHLDRALTSLCDKAAFPSLEAIELEIIAEEEEFVFARRQIRERFVEASFPCLIKTGYLTATWRWKRI
ncbi:hypothetical protein LshimejAT787_0312190 [Lyophyllum shimeji]|uniref:Uncharacterized protein n=1 Tax=Lyophyllum shimeji TaxID=47721 RepID=A0A9P3PKD6_LYOSH|nr:hypothetical protein LshimejAT787_0312190 [Lyophyllum shimeji]